MVRVPLLLNQAVSQLHVPETVRGHGDVYPPKEALLDGLLECGPEYPLVLPAQRSDAGLLFFGELLLLRQKDAGEVPVLGKRERCARIGFPNFSTAAVVEPRTSRVRFKSWPMAWSHMTYRRSLLVFM